MLALDFDVMERLLIFQPWFPLQSYKTGCLWSCSDKWGFLFVLSCFFMGRGWPLWIFSTLRKLKKFRSELEVPGHCRFFLMWNKKSNTKLLSVREGKRRWFWFGVLFFLVTRSIKKKFICHLAFSLLSSPLPSKTTGLFSAFITFVKKTAVSEGKKETKTVVCKEYS